MLVAAPDVATADHSVGVMHAPEIRSGSRAAGRLETVSQIVSISGPMVGLNGLVAGHCRILSLTNRCSFNGWGLPRCEECDCWLTTSAYVEPSAGWTAPAFCSRSRSRSRSVTPHLVTTRAGLAISALAAPTALARLEMLGLVCNDGACEPCAATCAAECGREAPTPEPRAGAGATAAAATRTSTHSDPTFCTSVHLRRPTTTFTTTTSRTITTKATTIAGASSYWRSITGTRGTTCARRDFVRTRSGGLRLGSRCCRNLRCCDENAQ